MSAVHEDMPGADAVETFPRTLSGTAKAWRRLMNERLGALGLSQAKWTALVLLDKDKGGLRQCDLAAHMGIEGASLAGLLDRMAADGWIERRPCPDDRRANLVFLSDKSHGTLEKIYRIADEVSHRLLDDIPPAELAACRRVLAAIGERARGLSGQAGRQKPES